VALAAIASLLLAQPASAVKLRYVAVVGVGSPDSVRTVEAFCPAGFKVVGGGAFSNAVYSQTRIQGSYPIDGPDGNEKADDGWRATMWNTGMFPNFESQAICADVKPEYRSKPWSVGITAPPRVKCLTGTKPSGGGIETAGTFSLPVGLLSTRPSDGQDEDTQPEAWFANASPPGMQVLNARTYAICVEPGDFRPRYRSGSFTAGTQDQDFGTKSCRTGDQVVGLGGATNATGSALVTIFGMDNASDDDLTLDNGATVTVDNFNISQDIFPEVYAVCVATG